MKRCDYDALFYRVFCITLLAIAFTLTVILTNVFVDIDGLLAKKDQGKSITRMTVETPVLAVSPQSSEVPSNDEMVYGDTEERNRNKRSSENHNFAYHIENPNLKRILVQKLTNLLEEFEREEPATAKVETEKAAKNPFNDLLINQMVMKETIRDKKIQEMFHTALHKLLLNGILQHMNFQEVYRHILTLADSLQKVDRDNRRNSLEPFRDFKPFREPGVEESFLKELVNCKDLHGQVFEHTGITGEEDQKVTVKNPKHPNVMIKTMIDITSTDKHKNENDTTPKENIKGIIKLIYNGKNILLSRLSDESTQQTAETKHSTNNKVVELTTMQPSTIKVDEFFSKPKVKLDLNKIPKSDMDKFVEEYFKRFNEYNGDNTVTTKIKRSKRNINVRYENENKSTQSNKSKNKDDDELYVEIETHFDSKGIKSERKKKLISGLVKKIQKAISSDKAQGKKIKHKHLHVKKRLQNPLEHNTLFWMNKITSPISSIIHREVSPIPNVLPYQETLIGLSNRSGEGVKKNYVEYITDKSGEAWKKPYIKPGFLNVAKSLNSAEKGEVDVDYNKVLETNGIPQRLQKPLNTDDSDESLGNLFHDMGNLKFLIKDVDGTGLSIGFNQFADEPPDSDSIKLFTDLKNIVNTYHQTYDDNDISQESNLEDIKPAYLQDINRNNDHTIVRRSTNNKYDYHLNKYKMLYGNNLLPYDSYLEILTKPKNNIHTSDKTKNAASLTVDENIFEKNLKPAEIFELASFFQRNKRSMNVQKISNIKTKMKLNRFLNTHSMPTKRIFLNNKRSKRQINKIRIIATDIPDIPRQSNENIFVVSDEKVFADRALVREYETPLGDSEDYRRKQEGQEDNIPFYEDSHPTVFGGRSRHNALSSKYPHILLEEVSRSKEDEFHHDGSFLFSNILEHNKNIDRDANDVVNIDSITQNTTENDPQLIHYFNSIMPANYKVSVKFIPKNGSQLHGFKEVHTSINKSYNKNGLLYSSLVNVSEISKIINLNNKTKSSSEDKHEPNPLKPTTNPIQEQQQIMKSLLDQHKKHIDEQLKQLRHERSKLDIILAQTNHTNNKKDNYINLLTSSNPNEVHHVTQDEVIKTESKSLVTESSTIILPVTTNMRQTRRLETPDVGKPLNPTVIDAIARNMKLTNQVLNKIDENTLILQQFLRKLTEHIAPTTQKPRVDEPIKVELPKEWKPLPLAVPKFVPAMVEHRNDSQQSIPFVYAYQRPIPSNKPNANNLASVVYHGHIHTNTISNQDYKDQERLDKVRMPRNEVNQSRFFIDNLMATDLHKNKRSTIFVRDGKYTAN